MNIVNRRLAWFAAVALAAASLAAEILKGPYVLLEDAQLLRVRFEVDTTDYEAVLLAGAAGRTRVVPAYTRGARDTFLAEIAVDLAVHRPFRGYEIARPGEPPRKFEWRSQIDGGLAGYPRLLVFGDSQGGAQTLAQLARQWQTEKFDLIVGLGDLADAGSRYESWGEEFFEPLRDILPHAPLLPICGNHDSYREKSLEWFDWFFGRQDRKRYFKIDFGDLRLIGFNNSDVHTKYGFDPIDPLSPQYDFLIESALGASASDKKLAFFSHIPMYSGSSVVNTEFGSELQRKYVLPLIERARVLGFFSGHHHKFERVERPGLRGSIQHIVTGGGGGRLFTAARERGGTRMDREIFEVYHYLTVDFSGPGKVLAKAMDGKTIDRLEFSADRTPESAERSLEFWAANVTGDLAVRAVRPIGSAVELRSNAPALSRDRSPPTVQFYRAERGVVALARNLASAGTGEVSFQGYDWQRKAWSYLQGGSLVIPTEGLYGLVALVSLNGTSLAPLDRCFPILHWPLAAVRAGLDKESGAALLLKGRRDFEFDPAEARLVAKWRWGDRSPGTMAAGQEQRQWSLFQAAPPLLALPAVSTEILFQLVAEHRPPQVYVLQAAGAPPAATLMYWAEFGFLSVVIGENLADANASLFVPIAAPTRIESVISEGSRLLRIGNRSGETLFLPLAVVKRTP